MKPTHATRQPTLLLLTALALGGCAISHVPSGDGGAPDVFSGEAGDVAVDGTLDGGDAGDAARDADAGDAPDAPDAPTCGDASTNCNGACVDLRTDPRHCGACDNDCTGLPGVRPDITCAVGVCQVTGACLPNFGNCNPDAGAGCQTNLNTVDNCGACNNQCGAAAPLCSVPADGGVVYTCSTGCTPSTPDRCGSNCTDLQTDTQHCGTCTNDCTATVPAHTLPGCTAGACVSTGCATGWGNCDTSSTNGCETDLTSDQLHCGSCQNACTPGTHQTALCVASACQFTCVSGFGDCDGDASTGCETNTTNTLAHCGACDNACTAAPAGGTPVCRGSACDFDCTPPNVRSGSACVAPETICPGLALAAPQPGRHTVVTGTTAGAGAELQGANGNGGDCSNTQTAPDVVYQITPTVSGRLTATLTAPGFDAVLYARSACDQQNTQTACANASAAHGQETLTLNVTAGSPVFLVVDGVGGASGAFGLDLLLDNACGDHVLDAGENCDDGNTATGDGCEGFCAIGPGITENCGGTVPGITVAPGQQVYAGTIAVGNSNDVACTGGSAGAGRELVYKLVPAADGTLRIDYAPSGYDAVLYTDTMCRASSPSACVDATSSPATESTSLSVTRLSPVYLFADSAGASDRGGFTLTFNLAVCGNGSLESGEDCDDGNATAGDGCTNCQLDPGCDVTDNGTNTFLSPQTLPSTCRSVRVSGSLTDMNDEAAYVLALPAGARVRLRTYQTSPDVECAPTYDPLLEVYNNATSAPTNATCTGSNALLCQDNASATNFCEDASFVTPFAATYAVRLLAANHAQTLGTYKLLIQY